MDKFGWGNTRIVLDDGGSKKIIANNNDMKFNESMIPYKKYSSTFDLQSYPCYLLIAIRAAYEAETWGDDGSGNSYGPPPEFNQESSVHLSAPQPRLPTPVCLRVWPL